jgi:alcohol dehydrogenase
VATRRNPLSDLFARQAWQSLVAHYPRVLQRPEDLEARAAMLLGAHFAGLAIENSMLGATHACANPVTAHYGTTHGMAIAILLPQVVRWNKSHGEEGYAELLRSAGIAPGSQGAAESLAAHLEKLAEIAGLPQRLSRVGVARDELPTMAGEAAAQWTGRFNPRPFDAAGAMEIYNRAF